MKQLLDISHSRLSSELKKQQQHEIMHEYIHAICCRLLVSATKLHTYNLPLPRYR